MTLAHWLERTAQAHPDLPAVAIGRREYRNYRTLAANAARISGWLEAGGYTPAARIALVAENRPECFEILFGAWWRGCIAITLPADLDGPTLAALLRHSGAQICFADARSASKLATYAPPTIERLVNVCGPDYRRILDHEPTSINKMSRDVAALVHYRPDCFDEEARENSPFRGAVLTHDALMNVVMSHLAEIDVTTPRDAVLHVGPVCEGAAIFALPAIARGGVIVTPETGGFDAAETFDLAAAWRRASILATPGILRDMAICDADCDPTSFRSIILSADDGYAGDKVAALDRFGPRIAEIYGQPEQPLTITRLNKHDVAAREEPHWRHRIGSVGRAFLMARLQIRDASGEPTPPHGIGEIAVQSPQAMLGFWREPEASVAMFDKGWLLTGTLGSLDEHGFLTLHGQTNDVIQTEAGTLFPRRIEREMRSLPGVEDAVIVSDGNAHSIAFVQSDAAPEALEAECRRRWTPVERPRRVIVRETLPRRRNGAVARRALQREAVALWSPHGVPGNTSP